jgi:CRISPR/Cas system CSM-associated protein Csm4 (group 5 of RAMP superfamily)
MTKSTEIVKKALKKPNLFSLAELAFFTKWLDAHKKAKQKAKELKKAKQGSERSDYLD